MSQLIAPALAGFLMTTMGLDFVLSIDVGTCLFAIGTLLVIQFPNLPDDQKKEGAMPKNSISEMLAGWEYVKARPGFLILLFYFGYSNFISIFITELLPPLLLSFVSVEMLGFIASFAGIGVILGGVAVSQLGTPSRKVLTIVVLIAVQGLIMTSATLQPGAVVIGIAGFFYLSLDPVIISCSAALWMSKTPMDIQGRVSAVRHIVAGSVIPLGSMCSGPLADLFEEWMAVGGPLQDTFIGRLLGPGHGRGICLLWIVLGLSLALVSFVVYSLPRLKNLESEIPDAVQPTVTQDKKDT